MARVTVEDCLKTLDNRFGLVHLTAKRVRQLRERAKPYLESRNKDIVLSLREIAAGKIYSVSADEVALARSQAEAREREALSVAMLAAESSSIKKVIARLDELEEDADQG